MNTMWAVFWRSQGRVAKATMRQGCHEAIFLQADRVKRILVLLLLYNATHGMNHMVQGVIGQWRQLHNQNIEILYRYYFQDWNTRLHPWWVTTAIIAVTLMSSLISPSLSCMVSELLWDRHVLWSTAGFYHHMSWHAADASALLVSDLGICGRLRLPAV